MEKLTDRQYDILQTVKKFIAMHGYPPTVREIGRELDLRSPATIHFHLKKLAEKAFLTVGAKGLSRVDFFLKEDGEVILNEINTMPGFTKISMYPKLFEAAGIEYSKLIDRLIQLAIYR